MDKELLKSIMVLHGDTNKDLAEWLRISEQSISYKINEKGTEFKQGEIAKICERYNLTPEQVVTIFLLKSVLIRHIVQDLQFIHNLFILSS